MEANRRRVPEGMVDEDLPGGGQFECMPCSRLFISQAVLDDHLATKSHKRRLRDLKVKPYTLEEAQAAGGSASNEFYTKHLAALNK